jgi:hypothetical protein
MRSIQAGVAYFVSTSRFAMSISLPATAPGRASKSV